MDRKLKRGAQIPHFRDSLSFTFPRLHIANEPDFSLDRARHGFAARRRKCVERQGACHLIRLFGRAASDSKGNPDTAVERHRSLRPDKFRRFRAGDRRLRRAPRHKGHAKDRRHLTLPDLIVHDDLPDRVIHGLRIKNFKRARVMRTKTGDRILQDAVAARILFNVLGMHHHLIGTRLVNRPHIINPGTAARHPRDTCPYDLQTLFHTPPESNAPPTSPMPVMFHAPSYAQTGRHAIRPGDFIMNQGRQIPRSCAHIRIVGHTVINVAALSATRHVADTHGSEALCPADIRASAPGYRKRYAGRRLLCMRLIHTH